MSAELADWLTLLSVHGIGPAAFAAAVQHFGSPTAVLRATTESLRKASGVGPAMARAIRDLARDPERRQLLGAAARETARARFARPRLGEEILSVYRRLGRRE